MHYERLAEAIFFPRRNLPKDLKDVPTQEKIMEQIRSDTYTYSQFVKMPLEAQRRLVEFCMGNRNLKITYEPFFQHIFNPELHPERLTLLLSAILKQKVKIIHVMPREGKRLSHDSSLVIMDILVELEDGSYVNVEIQKFGYYFPMQRSFCYGADMLVRQYAKLKEDLGDRFTYRHMRPVFVIVIMENSPKEFSEFPDDYIHRSIVQFDTGLKLGNLMNLIYIPLDIFRNMPHNEIGELEAWLYFLGSDEPKDINRIIEKYPFFEELYQEIVYFRYHPKELVGMYSEALAILDRNTVEFMLDDMKKEADDLRVDLNKQEARVAEMNAELSQMETELSEKDAELSQKDAELFEKTVEISKKDAEISQKDAEISQKDAEISQKDAELSQKDAVLSQKDAEIARLKALLEQR
ncbi:MAG: PD-(D/E)XK nuclease family transposase [Lachnospiraceae bacterium]|nr:PD-(D/E)XK nuclease family transposase [Lachnospiraceae bacterium]